MKKRVRAIIIEDGNLLTIKRVKTNETYWVFPGGGVESGENDFEALKRECQEELGVDVVVGKKLGEYIFDSQDFGKQLEIFYFCKIVGGQLGTGDGPEYQENNEYIGTHELDWLKLSQAPGMELRPHNVRDIVVALD